MLEPNGKVLKYKHLLQLEICAYILYLEILMMAPTDTCM